ncbi:hypothetical protein [Jiangella alba]|uniref:Uncharacterized protein n=1 Tax=Jiangella alba TaxID=561176 RepID=A0A1H5PDB8_9ACTN|nr:hypothetical protein [Jiangella alba]SEF11786.1 hypothetical protein SAMN04488561_4124 [Jiangella alba]
MAIQPGDNILYMKVGTHASEELADIIGRKRAEIEAEGMAFWGYGGNTCHPASMVRPFALGSTGPIVLAMQPMTSKHFAEPVRAEEYSEDGIKWRQIPEGINCVGSRYALLVDSLDEVDDVLDLSRTRVAVGPSLGKSGANYIQGRVDKACLEVTDESTGQPKIVEIKLRANLVAPHAVFLRN